MALEETSYPPVGRVLLEIAYDGTAYSGWQIQPHRPSVQGVLQRVLTKLYDGQSIHLIGSSRTDAGVHALGFAASFLLPPRPVIPPAYLRRALNRLLPPDIRIAATREVPLEFHTRYDALGKAYAYILNLGAESPFTGRYSYHPIYRIEPERLAVAAQRLVGTHDYSSFVVERSKIDNAVRTIYSIEVRNFGSYCALVYTGNGFLYKMIRCLTGTLIFAGAGLLSADQVEAILAAKDRAQAKDTAPAHGLYLCKVFFDQAELERGYHLEALPFSQ